MKLKDKKNAFDTSFHFSSNTIPLQKKITEMEIAKNTVVEMNYTLSNSGGILLDTTSNRDPLLFMLGTGALIKGLEEELKGRKADDKFSCHIKCEDAYGAFRADLVHVVPKENFNSEGDETLSEGMQVQVDTNNGVALALVTKMEGEDVTLDLNHPLADMDLKFDIEIVSVRAATNDEIGHGHAHGPEGCGQ
ncbi:MAG: FKBP-type peptidyl-prolyl cis-trans isomerase SlyD [Parvicella sp.]|jgi:FKBP-type peptidyl-prolyl cis-trans isomerase SlyD